MLLKSQHTLLEDFIADFAEGKLSKPELQAFSELQESDPEIRKMAQSGIRVHNKLRNLKKVTARPGFDQRMAAKFAMELEREVKANNRNRIGYSPVTS